MTLYEFQLHCPGCGYQGTTVSDGADDATASCPQCGHVFDLAAPDYYCGPDHPGVVT